MKKLIFYFSLILILNTSCTDTNSKVDKSETIESTNKIIGKDLSGELFYLGDTLSIKINSKCEERIYEVLENVLHEEGHLEPYKFNDIYYVSKIAFAKNNLLKITYSSDKSYSYDYSHLSIYYKRNSVDVDLANYTKIIKYSLIGDTLILPATRLLAHDVLPSKYLINIKGDTIVYLKQILNSDELLLRRERVRNFLNDYSQIYPQECLNGLTIDALTNSSFSHTFLKLKYD